MSWHFGPKLRPFPAARASFSQAFIAHLAPSPPVDQPPCRGARTGQIRRTAPHGPDRHWARGGRPPTKVSTARNGLSDQAYDARSRRVEDRVAPAAERERIGLERGKRHDQAGHRHCHKRHIVLPRGPRPQFDMGRTAPAATISQTSTAMKAANRRARIRPCPNRAVTNGRTGGRIGIACETRGDTP